jgi:aryl-alcohol dehydrogenase-like predicted oxidoreductase
MQALSRRRDRGAEGTDGVEHVPLGRSGLTGSRVALGTMNFGAGAGGVGTVDEADARRIIDAFLDAGHNIIDTADVYNGGLAEEIVGRAVRARRQSVVIATKGYLPLAPGPNGGGLSRLHLTRALDASLRRLGTDYIDLYQCHHPDPDTPLAETMATLDGFVRAGKVRYLGCSNFTASQIVEARWAAQRINGAPFISLQPQYSLLARDVEAEILPVCDRHGLGTLIWGPLGGGILTGRYQRGAPPPADTRIGRLLEMATAPARRWARDQLDERAFDIADEVAGIAAEIGTTPASVALAWVRARPGVTSVVIGPRTIDHYEQAVSGLALALPDDLTARLDAASGPPPRPVTGIASRP